MGLSHFSKKEMKHMSRNIPCTDHLGNTFPSIKDMCVYYNIAKNTFDNRIKKGCSLKEALTKHIQKKNKSCTDHLGNTFPTKSAMCEHYGISTDTFNKRRNEKHMSLKEALTTPARKTRDSCKDHLGNEFPSIAAMIDYYGITRKTFDKRRKKQISLKEILTTPVEKRKKDSYKDHIGNEFPSKKAMLDYYGVTRTSFDSRIKSSIEEALDIIPFICFKTKNTRITDNLFIKEVKAIRKKMLYAVCIYNDTETLLTHDEIIEIYRIETKNPP